jgi:hypothetical protein
MKGEWQSRMSEAKKGILSRENIKNFKFKAKHLWWIFTIIIFLTVKFPPFFPVTVSPQTSKAFNYMKTLSNKDIVIIGVDHTSAAWGEVYPLCLCVMKFLASQKVNLVFLSFNHYEANALTSMYLDLLQLEKTWGYAYGVNYVNIGYITGGAVAFDTGGKNFQAIGTDIYGNLLSNMNLTKNLKAAKDFTCVFNLGGYGYQMWVQYWVVPYDTILITPTQSIYLPDILVWYRTGQVYAHIDSTKGGTELEWLTGFVGLSTVMNASSNMAYIFVIALMVLGNIVFAFSWFKKRSKGGKVK